MAPWVVALLAFLGGSGGLAGVYGLIRHNRTCKLLEQAVKTKDPDLVDATGRALRPWADSFRDVRQRRAARKATAPRKVRSVGGPTDARGVLPEQRDPAA